MPWMQYWDEHIEGIEEAEDERSKAWLAVLLLLRRREAWYRSVASRYLLRVPVASNGQFSVSSRRAVSQTMNGLNSNMTLLIRATARQLISPPSGNPNNPIPTFGPRRTPRNGGGFLDRRARDIADQASRTARAAAKIQAQDEERASQRIKELSAASTEAERRELERLRDDERRRLAEYRQRIRDDEESDIAEARRDMMANILRNLNYKGSLLVEDLTRIVSRHHRPEDAFNLLLGAPNASRRGADRPWEFPRGTMELSTSEHLRALHRMRTIGAAAGEGVISFRMDLPKDRLAKFDKGGEMAKHLWKVRTLEEWEAIAGKLNTGRLSGATFRTFGLGFGDKSYIVPVPAVYRTAAIEHGKKLRARWIEAAVAAGAIVATERAAR